MIKKKQKEYIKIVSKFYKPLLVAVLVFAVTIQGLSFGSAAPADELKGKQQELNQLNAKIKENQAQINKLVKQSNTLKNQIELFSVQIEQLEAEVKVTQTKTEIVNTEIGELDIDIADKENRIDRGRVQLAELLREIHHLDKSGGTLMAIMNNDNLSDFLTALDQIKTVQGKSHELIQEVKQIKIALEDRKALAEMRKKELTELQRNLSNQQTALSRQISEKDQLLVQTKGQEQTYKQLVAQDQAEQSKIQKEINDLEAKIRAKIGPKATPGKKGIFVWPVNGVLTQGYGRTGFTAMGYNWHNGLDISSGAGKPMFAVYDGVVHGTERSNQSYGNWVTIKHTLPDGRQVITLYAHMMSFNVSPGQTVKQGQVIGAEGNTGFTTRLIYGPHRGFHVHFVVFDVEGYTVAKGRSGGYSIPTGYTYNPLDFL